MALSRSFIRGAAMSPLDARLANMASIVANADGTPRVGVLGARPDIVTALGTMHVSVGVAEFATSKSRADGVPIFTNDGPVSVAIPAAPASNSRIDVIWVKHNDAETGDVTSLPVFGVTSGAAAASPVKPGVPTGALELATLRVYAGTTAANGGSNVLTNTARMTTARGGIVPFRTKTELNAWTTPEQGQRASVIEEGAIYTFFGSMWRLTTPFAEASGVVNFSGSSEHDVNFPAGLFTLAPIMQVTVIAGSKSTVGIAYFGPAAPQITKDDFKVRIFSTGGASIGGLLHWTAKQATALSAAG